MRDHYKNDPNPNKIKAANFLLDNIYTHKTLKSKFVSKNGEAYPYDEFDHETIDDADKELTAFMKSGGKHKLTAVYDIENANAPFIISIVDNSIRAWEESPWKNSYNFETFCEYILPYRNTTEPVAHHWKKHYYNEYRHIIDNAEDPEDPISVCTSLLQEMDYFEFQRKRPFPQPALSIGQMHYRKKGLCEDLASVALLNARAIGLAVTYDFTPHNAASSNAHYWNTIINKEGGHIPFNGSLELPYNYDANYRRLGKVFRKVFSYPKDNLTRFVKPTEIPDKKLRDQNIIDVTHEYVDTYNVDYQFKDAKNQKVAYITVFNKNRWRAIWWSKINNGFTNFTNMGSNIVYLPALTKDTMVKGRKRPVLDLEEYPIWVNKKGVKTILKPNFGTTFSCFLSRENEMVGPYRDFNTVELTNGQTFNLHYWEGKWKFIASEEVKEGALSFCELPKNALFRVTPEKPDGFERIFLISGDNCRILWF